MGTLHGMRASFRTWAAEFELGEDPAEAALAHKIPSAVVRAYQRSTFEKKRRELMIGWGLYVA